MPYVKTIFRMNIVAIVALAAVLAASAWGDEFQVTNTFDAGIGSLRQAILNANSAGGNPTITFNTAPGSPFNNPATNATIALTSGELEITVPLAIQGIGAKTLIISGSGLSRVFNIDPGSGNTVSISGVTIRDGGPQADQTNGGGGILVASGIFTLTDSEVTNNDASNSSNPIGGGIDNEGGTVNLERCAIVNNTAVVSGGGIQNAAGGSMTLVNCTLAGNTAGANGTGGGIYNVSATVTLINCTLFGNSAQFGGNSSNSGGMLSFQNTIIASGVLLGSGGSGPDINGATYNSLDYNLIQTTTGGTIGGATGHNITGVSPMLSALADNGGPTRTLAMRIGSPVIDAGSAVTDPITNAPLALDQRGLPRPIDNAFVNNAAGGNGSDIGALEMQPTAPTISITTIAYAFENASSGSIPFTIGDADTPIADLMVSASSADTTLLPNSGIQLIGTGANRTVIMTPAPNLTGNVLITFSVSDGTFTTDAYLYLTVTTPPAITSENNTVFTIGQQCPELVNVGDTSVEVGTPCPFTVTTSGTPAPSIWLGGVALPSGVYFVDNLDGTGTLGGIPGPGTAGQYALTFTATNSLGSSQTQNFTLTINTPPIFESATIAAPNPATVGQTVTFSTGVVDLDGNALTYDWYFGDSSADGTGPNPTHTYAAEGNYMVFLTVTDTAAAFVNDQVTVIVNGNGNTGGGPGGNENQAVVGSGPDTDGDGFSDAFETAVGTDPNNAASTPTGHPITTGTLQPLTLTATSIKLNFAKTGGDTITFTGTLPVPMGVNLNGAKVCFDVGGVAKFLTLKSNGSTTSGGNSIKLAVKTKNNLVTSATAKYTVTFSKGTFAATLAGSTDLINTTETNKVVMVKFTIVFNNAVYQNDRAMIYTAKMNKTGAAK